MHSSTSPKRKPFQRPVAKSNSPSPSLSMVPKATPSKRSSPQETAAGVHRLDDFRGEDCHEAGGAYRTPRNDINSLVEAIWALVGEMSRQQSRPERSPKQSPPPPTPPSPPSPPSHVVLNVGGKLFETEASTLVGSGEDGDGMLGKLVSGAYKVDKCSKGHIFLDRDASVFHIVLWYLRLRKNNTTPVPLTVLPSPTASLSDRPYVISAQCAEQLWLDADYFGLDGLKRLVNLCRHPRARSVDCRGCGEFTNLEDAFNASVMGDMIVVWPGEYTLPGRLTVRRDLTVVGFEGAESTRVMVPEPISWRSASGHLRGLTLRNEGGPVLMVDGGAGITVEECSLEGTTSKHTHASPPGVVMAQHESQLHLVSSNVQGSCCTGIVGAQFSLEIEGCTFTGDSEAASCLDLTEAQVAVEGSVFEGWRCGIRLKRGSIDFRDSEVKGCRHGVVLSNCEIREFERNKVIDNAKYGVFLSSCTASASLLDSLTDRCAHRNDIFHNSRANVILKSNRPIPEPEAPSPDTRSPSPTLQAANVSANVSGGEADENAPCQFGEDPGEGSGSESSEAEAEEESSCSSYDFSLEEQAGGKGSRPPSPAPPVNWSGPVVSL